MIKIFREITRQFSNNVGGSKIEYDRIIIDE